MEGESTKQESEELTQETEEWDSYSAQLDALYGPISSAISADHLLYNVMRELDLELSVHNVMKVVLPQDRLEYGSSGKELRFKYRITYQMRHSDGEVVVSCNSEAVSPKTVQGLDPEKWDSSEGLFQLIFKKGGKYREACIGQLKKYQGIFGDLYS